MGKYRTNNLLSCCQCTNENESSRCISLMKTNLLKVCLQFEMLDRREVSRRQREEKFQHAREERSYKC